MTNEVLPVTTNALIHFCDMSGLGKLRISGKDSHDFIRIMFTADVGVFKKIGNRAAALLLTGEAEVIDVVMIIRTGDNEYMVTTNEENTDEAFSWLLAHSQIKDEQGAIFGNLNISDESDALADIVLFGSGARKVLSELSKGTLDVSPSTEALSMVQLGNSAVLLLDVSGPLGFEQDAFELLCPNDSANGIIYMLMSFPEINPIELIDYIQIRTDRGTWFAASKDVAYVYPDDVQLMHLVRAQMDFVGGKSLSGRQ